MDFEKWQIIYRCSFVLFILFLLSTVVCMYKFRIISILKYKYSIRNEKDVSVSIAAPSVTEENKAVSSHALSDEISDSAAHKTVSGGSGTLVTPESSGTVILSAKEMYSDFKIVKDVVVMDADKEKLI